MSDNTNKYWRDLRWLGSAELVRKTFQDLHSRELSRTRAEQITANYLQASEYFKNAKVADITVRPLLLFYGVSSLSRALVLLLRVSGGAETLSVGHGLKTLSWGEKLQPDVSASIKNLGDVGVKKCGGLFSDLIDACNNTSALHIQSSAVDWRISYNIPPSDFDLTFEDVVARLPDVRSEYENWSDSEAQSLYVNEISVVNGIGALKVRKQDNLESIISYAADRIETCEAGAFVSLKVELADFPILLNSFTRSNFAEIPSLFMCQPFPGKVMLAQMPHSFALSFILGMLCRYYPSHWMALCRNQGDDSVWPLIQGSLDYLEDAYPRMVLDFLSDQKK